MAKYLKLPNLKILEDVFLIDENSPSGLTWKNPPGRRLKPGDRAGSFNGRYWHVCLNYKYYLCARIIYYMETKHDPLEYHIDHKKRDATINADLRPATASQNNANRAKPKTRDGIPTTSKYKGVSWFKRDKKWKVNITVNKKHIYLGVYDSEVEAAKAYNEAAIKFFGEFACLNNLSINHV